MSTYTADLRRTAQDSQHYSTLRTLFITIIIFVLMFVLYFLTQEKQINNVKPAYFYPHWKKKQPPLMACGVPVENDPIVKVTNLKAYMVGSYVEHRQKVKQIRTIAIVLRSENTGYQCILCCNGRTVSVSATHSIHSDHFGFEYGTADIFCKVPEKCPTPTHVAITSRSVKENKTLQDIHAFQPIRNQKKLEVFPYEFTVCISAMYDYVDVLMLVQAMEMFKILGVQRVAIYKTSCHPVTQKVLDYYVSQNFVEIIPWRISSYINVSRGWKKSVSPGELHYFGQIAALNDCVYRYMYQSHYVALQDLDEFILPINLKNWTELLPELERKYNHNVGFEFENNFFPVYMKDPKPGKNTYSPDSWKKVNGLNILEYVYRISNDPTMFNNFKVIVNPRLVFEATVHGLLQSLKGTVRVDHEIARMYHIKNFQKKVVGERSYILDTHLRDYADRLIPAVSNVLQKVLGI
ncbi:hypothetical protein KOW79_003143 [Hemibagrus wyckioides]|uniref:Glycosyltransferase family 92 protein n=1 Tax=Hemibagrus wyckioides TaxID=337641 RepID=A0A9D3P1P0_9TELE|nr:beta-1,4-galactosyltransferase galt-1-like [Hemibagrus wyckioides]KAG7333008.1 hypothetical protein KOW79_003143 [Hemibagrus wyckioides]